MRVELQNAFVLHVKPYRESSLIVNVLSRDHGKISLIAKGVRSQRKSANVKRALLQPFRPLLISWVGKGELKSLSDVESLGIALALRNERLYCGLYINELLLRLLAKYDCPDNLFTYYQACLTLLTQTDSIELVLRRFEFTLFEYLGFGINFDTDYYSGELISTQHQYRYIPQHGFVLSPATAGANQQHLINGGTIKQLSQGVYNAAVLQSAKQICRVEIASHLGSQTLNSRELFKQYATNTNE